MDSKYRVKGFGRTRKMTNGERLEFIQQLLREHEQGISLNTLADRYGIKRNTAKYMIQKAKRYREDTTSVPMTKQEIANMLHIHVSTLWRRYKKYGNLL